MYCFGFRFSFVAPCLLENGTVAKKNETPQKSLGTAPGNFFEEYVLMDVLGRGSYSVCRLARHRTTGQHYAVKVSKLKISLQRFNSNLPVRILTWANKGVINSGSSLKEKMTKKCFLPISSILFNIK